MLYWPNLIPNLIPCYGRLGCKLNICILELLKPINVTTSINSRVTDRKVKTTFGIDERASLTFFSKGASSRQEASQNRAYIKPGQLAHHFSSPL